jgi:hypothetical protein
MQKRPKGTERSEAVSRHHILPPIIYTPEPPKPKETRRRRGVGNIQGKGATDEADETGETSEVSGFGPARAAAQPPQDPFAPIDGAERRIPSTTGKLSENTLKELLLAQEHDQESATGVGSAVAPAKE